MKSGATGTIFNAIKSVVDNNIYTLNTIIMMQNYHDISKIVKINDTVDRNGWKKDYGRNNM